MSDIVERCRDRMVCSPPQNSCRNDFALEQAAYRIEELEAQLAAMTAERDRLDAAIKRQAGAAKTLRQHTLAEVQHIKDNERKQYLAIRTLDSEREANAILTDELETYRAAIPVAYQMALEAGAVVSVDYGKIQYSANIQHHPQYANDAADDAIEIANAIRALTPPADLVERVLKTKETNT